MAAFRGMHVSPAKHSFGKCDRKVWQMDRQMDGQTDRRRTKWSLCVAMLRRRHKKERTHAKIGKMLQKSNLICIMSRQIHITTFKSVSQIKQKSAKLNFSKRAITHVKIGLMKRKKNLISITSRQIQIQISSQYLKGLRKIRKTEW